LRVSAASRRSQRATGGSGCRVGAGGRAPQHWEQQKARQAGRRIRLSAVPSNKAKCAGAKEDARPQYWLCAGSTCQTVQGAHFHSEQQPTNHLKALKHTAKYALLSAQGASSRWAGQHSTPQVWRQQLAFLQWHSSHPASTHAVLYPATADSVRSRTQTQCNQHPSSTYCKHVCMQQQSAH
jgi:hypothetical protein